MAIFDPKKAREANQNNGIPAGEYLLAIHSFVRKTSKAKKPYLHCRILVIAGPAKKRSFFDNVSLDLDNSGAMFRLSMLAEQCGATEAFELDDDDAIQRALVGRPFKALVKRETSGEYINNGIERYVMGDRITEGDKRLMQEWVAERAENEEWSGRGDDAPPPGDDDFGGAYRGKSTGGGIDDDIPF